MNNVTSIDRARKVQPPPRDPDGRPLPSNTVVEAALLDQLMSPELSAPELTATLRLLVPEHFFAPPNARVFEAMRELSVAGTTIEPVTLFAKLKDVPAPTVGWMRYLTEVLPVNGAHAEARPTEYAKIILDRWRAREVVKACARVVDLGFAGAESAALIDEARGALNLIADTQLEVGGATAHDALEDAWRHLIANGQPGQRGLSWGWPSVDAAFGRLRPGRVTVLAAVPGVGKTNIAWHVAEAAVLEPEDEYGVGEAVYFVSAELRDRELVSRQAGIRAGVPPSAIEGDRELSPEELGRMVDSQKEIASMPIVVDDNRGRAFNVTQIEARVRSAQSRLVAGTFTRRDGARFPRSRLRLVVVDYLTKLRPPPKPQGQKYDSREREVAAISEVLVELAKVLDVHILLVAAVSRPPNKGTDNKKRELQMSDLRESGMIEYDAASIIFANVPNDGVIRLKTDKQRFRQEDGPVELAMVGGRIFEPRAR